MKYEKTGKNVFVMIDELFYDVVVGAIELPTKLIIRYRNESAKNKGI